MSSRHPPKGTIKDSDWVEYLELLKSTGQEVNVAKLTPREERNLKNDCWIWVQNNKPSAVMPTLKDTTEKIHKVYRVKILGKQYLWAKTVDSKEIGREWKIEYDKMEEIDEEGKPTGKMVDNPKAIIKKEAIYSIPFNKEVAKEYVDRAIHSVDAPRFYCLRGRYKFATEPEQFINGDIDKIARETLATAPRV